MKPLGLIEDYPGKFLHLTVTTEEDRTELEVKLGPKWSKRTKSRNHGLWFPYHKIVDSEYPLKEYLKCYMDCLPIIFREFGVTEAQLEQVRLNCEKAILNNQEYEMTEKEINEHEEAYDLGEKFAKELGIK